MTSLSANDLYYSFGGRPVLKNISFDIAEGEWVSLLGPSGCGKTTLLKILAGHLIPDGGNAVSSGKTRLVHQRDSLFPWMSVYRNADLALRGSTITAKRKAMIRTALENVQLHEFENEYPHRLSVGMRQRIELARSMIGSANILLLDEPFSSLDPSSRYRMGELLADWLSRGPRTIVMASHDLHEARRLSNRTIHLSGTPATVARIEDCNKRSPSPKQSNPMSGVDEVLR